MKSSSVNHIAVRSVILSGKLDGNIPVALDVFKLAILYNGTILQLNFFFIQFQYISGIQLFVDL